MQEMDIKASLAVFVLVTSPEGPRQIVTFHNGSLLHPKAGLFSLHLSKAICQINIYSVF